MRVEWVRFGLGWEHEIHLVRLSELDATKPDMR